MFLQSAFPSILNLIFWIPLRVLRVDACARKWWPSPELLEDEFTLIARMMFTRMLFGAILGIPIRVVPCVAAHLFKHRQYLAKGAITAIYIGREREGRRVRGELFQHLKKHGLEGLETALEIDDGGPSSYREAWKFTTRAIRILYRDSFSFFRQFVSLIYIALLFASFLFISRVPGAVPVPLDSLDPLYGELPYTWDKGNRELLGMVLTILMGGFKLEMFHLLLTRWVRYPEQARDSARTVYSKLGEEWGRLAGGSMTRNDIRAILQQSMEHGGCLTSAAVVERLVAEICNFQDFEESNENNIKDV